MKEKYILTLVLFIIIVINSKIVFTSVEQIGATLTVGDETSVTNTNPTNQQGSSSSGNSKKAEQKDIHENTEKECKENWVCTEWKECTNNIQTMSCYDSNACNTFKMMPQLERKCDKISQNDYPKNEETPKTEKTKIINNLVGISIVTIIIINLFLLYIQKNKRKNKRKGI